MSGIALVSCSLLPFNHLILYNLRDVAEAHVLAMESDEAAGQRLIVSNGPFCIQDIC